MDATSTPYEPWDGDAALTADGVPIVERNEEPACTAFKCRDPDGHRIEVYWEPPVSR
jgi:hypothetical protein